MDILNLPFSSKRSSLITKLKVAVFTSGQGIYVYLIVCFLCVEIFYAYIQIICIIIITVSCTEALINYTLCSTNVSTYEVALVLSNSNESAGLLKAKEYNIPTKVTAFSISDYFKHVNSFTTMSQSYINAIFL